MIDWLLAISYPFRLVFLFFWSGAPACDRRWCARSVVGVSIWCRKHVDEVRATCLRASQQMKQLR